MVIADTDNKPTKDSNEPKVPRPRYRSLVKRRTQLSTAYLHFNWSINLQRQWNRRRMRRLFLADQTDSLNPPKTFKQKLWSYFIYSVLPLILVIGFSCGMTYYQNAEVFTKFMQRYTTQYQAIVHNKLNYCDRTMPLHDMFEHIQGAVINQEMALKQLEQALANQSFQSIALVGTSGVGKTLTMRKLLEKYPWPENVQTIAWNDYELTDNHARYKAVWKTLGNLAHCGRNLIIIDNMAMCDLEYMVSINSMVKSSSDVANGTNDSDKKYLTIIYVFNVNSMLPEEVYSEQLKMLQQVETTAMIVYRIFGPKDLEACVRHEQRLLDLNLDERHIEDMINTTNVKISGCKTVRAKVMVLGHSLMMEEEMHKKLEFFPDEGQ